MKKSALITALLLAMSASAAAYDCPMGGYSLDDSKAMGIVNSQKTFAMYSENKQDPIVHMVSYFTPEDVKTATNQELSAAKFEEMYQQMALLQRSRLKLDRKPTGMVDLKKYAEAQLPGSLVIFNTEERFEDIKPDLHIEKIGKNNAISYSYYLKKDKKVTGMTSTFLTLNDRLYLLSTINDIAEPEATKPEAEEEAPEAGKKLREYGEEAKKIFGEATEVEESKDEKAKAPKPESTDKNDKKVFAPVEASEVAENIKKQLWQKQLKFLKSVKFVKPVDQKLPFGFTDSYYGKQVNLPDDWAYAQIKVDKNDAVGLVTIATPLKTVRYITNDAMQDTRNLLSKSSEGIDKAIGEVVEKDHDKNSEDYQKARNYIKQLDQLLVTGSFQVNDPELGKMLSDPKVLKAEAYGFLKTGLERWKAEPMPEVKLNDYTLEIEAKDNKALLNLAADVTVMKDINLNGNLKAAARKDACMLLFFAKQKDTPLEEILEKALKEWQF